MYTFGLIQFSFIVLLHFCRCGYPMLIWQKQKDPINMALHLPSGKENKQFRKKAHKNITNNIVK